MSIFSSPLPAIPFFRALCLSDENATSEHRKEAIQAISSVYGERGVVSLWMLQGYYDGLKILTSGLTPATQWWLDENNAWRGIVKKLLSEVKDIEEAKNYLEIATCIPSTCWLDIHNGSNREWSTFTPGPIVKPSRLHATYVRQLAQTFFPQFPELSLPTCGLYTEHTYDKPFEAFAGDMHAQHYLACALPIEAIGQFSSEMRTFRFNRNVEWRMYDQMGLSLEESYITTTQGKPWTRALLPPPPGGWPRTIATRK